MEIDTSPSLSPSATKPSPPSSPTSAMQLDLTSLPPLIVPSPPTNTLLITNLQNPSIFTPPTLQTIRDLLSQHAPLHSFSPLKSLRRIITSFYSTDDALRIRQFIDGTTLMDSRVKVYFGVATPIQVKDQHLELPEAQKMFFISPPPSPPHGWTMRNEEPPNKAVHAEDLASALAALRSKGAVRVRGEDGVGSPVEMEDQERMWENRRRSGENGEARVVYHPDEHGNGIGRGLDLPAVTVEDTGSAEDLGRVGGLVSPPPPMVDGDGDEDMGGSGEGSPGGGKRIIAHTARPPVELMDCS